MANQAQAQPEQEEVLLGGQAEDAESDYSETDSNDSEEGDSEEGDGTDVQD